MQQNTIAIDIKLTDSQRDALVKLGPPVSNLTPTGIIAGLSQGAMQDLASGGAMLSPATIARLRGSLEDPYDESALVAAVEKGASKDGDATVIKYTIDPVYVTPLTDIAASNGMDLESLVQQCIGTCFEMGWFYEIIIDGRTIRFTNEQYAAIRAKIGKEQVFGEDIAGFMASVPESTAEGAGLVVTVTRSKLPVPAPESGYFTNAPTTEPIQVSSVSSPDQYPEDVVVVAAEPEDEPSLFAEVV
jgi:hypothetical protein